MNPVNQTSADEPRTAQGMFRLGDGRNVFFTFCLVSSLFLLWGFCNGMIDTMDKHFQEELHLSLSQSAWVQFAHWMGYFLMSLPAGWLATRLGYKGGIISGLLLVAVGGFWFIPASKIAAFWAFLLGVSVVAMGLTFLETVANPYTTVLGAPRYAATRINLAQSCNGVGWLLGPWAASTFFYATDAAGKSTGSQTLWIPYAGVGIAVLLLAVVFFFAPVPDIKGHDDYGVDAESDSKESSAPVRQVNRGLSYVLLLGNVAVLIGVFGMILWLVLSSIGAGSHLMGFASSLPHPQSMGISSETALFMTLVIAGLVAFFGAAIWLLGVSKRLSHHSIWSHEHFSGATLAQFFYVAAQAGIFSFLINYMTSEPPSMPAWLKDRVEYRTALASSDFKDVRSLVAKFSVATDPVSAFVATNLSSSTVQVMQRYQAGSASEATARVALQQDLNSIVMNQALYAPDRFEGIALSEKTKEALAQDEARSKARLNRLLLADAFPNELAFKDGVLSVTNAFAAKLVSLGFGFFLVGRLIGTVLLRKCSAHRLLGLYSLLNVILCLLVFLKIGWVSVAAVFLSYFFMSIMFPTIFALGIYGLGVKAKRAAAYIVMGIVGGAMLPKVMGAIADHYDMSKGFIMPLVCFVLIMLYGYGWPKLSRAEALHGVGTSRGH